VQTECGNVDQSGDAAMRSQPPAPPEPVVHAIVCFTSASQDTDAVGDGIDACKDRVPRFRIRQRSNRVTAYRRSRGAVPGANAARLVRVAFRS
jgi:hypothetical protein